MVGQVLDSSRGRGMTAIQPWLWKMCHVSQCTGMEGMDPGSGAGMTGEGGVAWVTMKRWHYKAAPPPLDPSNRLRVSGPTPPWDGFLPTQDDGGRG